MLNDGFTPQATDATPFVQNGDLHTAIREAAARGYQSEKNSGKELDADLLDAVCDEIERAVIPFLGVTSWTNNPANEAISALNPISPQSNMSAGTGDLLRHPDTGHLIGVEPAPVPANATTEYPKYITPDPSWVEQDATGRPMAPLLGAAHVDRGGNITVVVQSKDEEDRVLGAKPSDVPEPEFNPNADLSARIVSEPIDETDEEMAAEEAALAAEEARLAEARAKRKK